MDALYKVMFKKWLCKKIKLDQYIYIYVYSISSLDIMLYPLIIDYCCFKVLGKRFEMSHLAVHGYRTGGETPQKLKRFEHMVAAAPPKHMFFFESSVH